MTAALVEPHLHLDAVLTEGEPRSNRSGSLFEGIEIWAERVTSLTARGHHAPGRHRAPLAPGPRGHRPPGPRGRLRPIADRGAGAPPSAGGLARRDRHPARRVPPAGDPLVPRRREAHGRSARAGRGRRRRHPPLRVDPGVRRARTCRRRSPSPSATGVPADLHCDETDDDQSRFLEVLAAETIRLGLQGRVTASHTTAMHSYNDAYAYKLIRSWHAPPASTSSRTRSTTRSSRGGSTATPCGAGSRG